MAKKQGWQRGEGKFSSSSMDKDPIRPAGNDPGNSTTKPRQLNYDTLLRQGLSQRLPKSAK